MEKRMIWVWVGVAALVIGLSLWALGTFRTSAPPYQSGGPVPAQKNVPSYAPQGQLAPGFPPQLILDQNAVISTSYAVAYDGSINQYTATWNSSTSIKALASAYQNYFSQGGWTIKNQLPAKSNEAAVYGVNGGARAGMVVVDYGKYRMVTVTYIKQ